MQGYIYVLSNESMPGILKIGRSTRGGKTRATELYRSNTGVASPFNLEFEILVDDVEDSEAAIHEILQKERVNDSREFFKIELSQAVFCIIEETVCGDFDFYLATEFNWADPGDVAYLDHQANVVGPDFPQIISEMTPEEYAKIHARVIAKRTVRNAIRKAKEA